MISKNNKLIVILGQTASGKTDLSVKLAKKFDGEVVSADSRQVYKGMDIGSGKITRKEMQGIKHHLLDVASPKIRFSTAQYQKLSLREIRGIQRRGKVPILVGGTGFYIQSIVDGIVIPEVAPDWKLRKELEKLSVKEMFAKLQKLDPKRAEIIDYHNPRRLVRALEIVLKTGKPVPKLDRRPTSNQLGFDVLEIAILKTKEEIKKNIQKRLEKRLVNDAMIKEIKKLLKSGVSFKRLQEFGLEYRFVAQYIRGLISHQQMIDAIQLESEHYAKRQMTWFKRDGRIRWIKNYREAEKLIKEFI